MNTQLTHGQIDSYRDNGFLVVRGFLSAPELGELRAGVEAAVEMAEYFEQFPQFAGVMPVAGEMAPGDAGLHNGLLAHGAGPNMTPDWRRAMTAGYMPDGSVFNGIQNILSDAQVAALEIGDPLDDESQNPLLWRRGA